MKQLMNSQAIDYTRALQQQQNNRKSTGNSS